ncbi:hypothetical protein B0182_09830 [Moraxella bovis]|nr:hypothetical protein B0182_09830 [Moraxella bovis]
MIVVVYTLQNEKVLRFFVRGELSLPMTETDLQASLWQTVFVVKFNFVSCIFKEFFINSLFCRYRVYQDNSQILTLYKFKNH